MALKSCTISLTQAGQGIDSINVHRTTTTDTLATGAAKGQGRVNLILDSNQGIQHHGSRLFEIESIGLHLWFDGWIVWRPSIDVESLDFGILGWRGVRDC